MASLDPDCQAIIGFMTSEPEKDKGEWSRAEIMKGSGLGYNELVAALASLEGGDAPYLVRRTKGMAAIWALQHS